MYHSLCFYSKEFSVNEETFLNVLNSVTDKFVVVAVFDGDYYYYHYWDKISNDFTLFACSHNLYHIQNVICS